MINETKESPSKFEVRSQIPTGPFPVHVTKSNFFRVIHVDGFFGGGTPTAGNVIMTVYNHRVAFPDKAFVDVNGNEIPERREGKVGVEHEYEASLVMSLATAKAMVTWLTNSINNVENLMSELQQQNKRK